MEKLHACDYDNCKATFAKPNKLVIHKRVHTGERPYKCQKNGCNKSYTSSSHLNRHVRSVHSLFKSNVICPVCNLMISSLSNLRKHLSRIHKPNKIYPYKCEECTLGFYKKKQLAEHSYVHTGVAPYSCDLCQMKFTSLGQMNKHKRNHKTYKCECDVEFSRWSDYLKHKRLNHKKVYRCSECDKSFDSNTNYKSHINTHSEYKDVYRCPRPNCSRMYAYKKNLIHHVKMSHDGIKYKCTFAQCNKELSSKQKLLEHRKKIHSKLNDEKIRKKRAKRKDTGTYRRSTLLKLSGLSASNDVEKQIIEGKVTDIKIENDEVDETGQGGERENSVDRDNSNGSTEENFYFIDTEIDIKEEIIPIADNLETGNESKIKMIILEHKKFNTNVVTQ